MTSRVFGLRAANCPACNNWPQHSRFTAIECFAAASTALTPGSAGSAETLSRMMIRTPDVPSSPFTTWALCVAVVFRPRRACDRLSRCRASAATAQIEESALAVMAGGPPRSADHRDRAWIGVRTAAILAAGVAGYQFPSVFDAVECGVAV